jgi:hypothetical protein
MRRIEADVEIKAPAERVWAILMDFDAYPKWNPFIVSIGGEQRDGGRLLVSIKPPGHEAMSFKPKVVRLQPGEELRWLGRVGLPRIFDGEHVHHVESLGNSRSRYTQSETFRGLLVPFLGATISSAEKGFAEMCKALKKRAESKSWEGR